MARDLIQHTHGPKAELPQLMPFEIGICSDTNEVFFGNGDGNENIPLGAKGDTGENGATFTPHVSSEGILSFTNDKGIANPESIDLKELPFIKSIIDSMENWLSFEDVWYYDGGTSTNSGSAYGKTVDTAVEIIRGLPVFARDERGHYESSRSIKKDGLFLALFCDDESSTTKNVELMPGDAGITWYMMFDENIRPGEKVLCRLIRQPEKTVDGYTDGYAVMLT